MDTEKQIKLLSGLVRNLHLKPAHWVEPDTPLQDAIAMMRTDGVTSVLVGDGKHADGILTEQDILMQLTADLNLQAPVKQTMGSPVMTIDADAQACQAFALMQEKNFRHIPVTEADGRVIGVLRRQGLVKYLSEFYPNLILNQPPDPKIPPEVYGG